MFSTDELFCGESAADVFAIRLSSSPAIPLNYHEFFFVLNGMSQIHGGHPGATVQEKQNRERRVVSANENVLIYVTDADAFQRRDTVRFVDVRSTSGGEP